MRLTERAERVSHIPKNLYFRHVDRVDAYAGEAPEDGCRALSGHLERTGLVGSVSPGSCPGTYRVAYALAARPLVSILIPNKDAATVLRRCLDSIAERTTYPNYEVIVIENNSADASTFAYYDALAEAGKVHVIRWPGPFTFSEINNFGAKAARGDYLLFLNNDIEVITPDWIEQMLMYAQREDVGAVGAKLYYPDGRVQHAGVIVGVLGVGYHGFSGFSHDAQGYMCRLQVPVDLSAVTAACMLVRRNVFDEAEGFDPALAIAFNDVDLCLRIGEMRKRIVFTPYAEMYHHESYSRGSDEDTPEKHARFLREIAFFQSRWRKFLVQGDPYYHESLTLSHGGFFVEPVKRPYAAIFLREEGSDAGPA